MMKTTEKKIGMASSKINLECRTPESPVPPAAKQSALRITEHPATTEFPAPLLQNSQQSFDVPDRYAKQIKLQREWEERIECLN